MNSAETISHIPLELRTSSWLQPIIELLQEQAKVLQEQAKVLQEQAEQIAALKQTVQEQKDELARLRKMPKRPKFRPGGGDPKSRSGKPDNAAGGGGSNSVNKMTPQKARQEIRIPALGVPRGVSF